MGQDVLADNPVSVHRSVLQTMGNRTEVVLVSFTGLTGGQNHVAVVLGKALEQQAPAVCLHSSCMTVDEAITLFSGTDSILLYPGFPDGCDYTDAVLMLAALGISRIRLTTGDPQEAGTRTGQSPVVTQTVYHLDGLFPAENSRKPDETFRDQRLEA
ncbi:MAG: hypothetical protein M3O22_02280 [Pseudomonadota bacterium]|nr:hypothetical protein [Pseudomonadota bacterium]